VGFYSGPDLTDGVVALRAPDQVWLRRLSPAADVADEFEHWLSAANSSAEVVYFSLWVGDAVAGQILLHDIDLAIGETLIAYHIFEPAQRRQGYGTRALRLLQRYLRTTALHRAVIITSRDNLASQRIVVKTGFVYAGPAREDPLEGVVFTWDVRQA
jgi:RimJ/RimL family protein N-acetyltransferase